MSLLVSLRAKVAAARKALASASNSIGDVRAAVAKLQADRSAVESAPLPPAEAATVLGHSVDRLFGLVAPQYARLGDVVVAAAAGRVFDARQIPTPQLMALLLTALEPVVRDRLAEELTAFYDGAEAGLPAAEREQRLREIDAELLELQRVEESLIEELAGAGVAIDRRADAAVEAVLGIGQ